MIERAHRHIVSELQQGARTDTVFVVIAVLLNLVMLAISSGIAQDTAGNGSTSAVLAAFIALTAVVNVVVVFGLLKGRETRARLIGGLSKLYADQKVDGYYDPGLLENYNARYSLFIVAVVCMGAVAIAVPLLLR